MTGSIAEACLYILKLIIKTGGKIAVKKVRAIHFKNKAISRLLQEDKIKKKMAAI